MPTWLSSQACSDTARIDAFENFSTLMLLAVVLRNEGIGRKDYSKIEYMAEMLYSGNHNNTNIFP